MAYSPWIHRNVLICYDRIHFDPRGLRSSIQVTLSDYNHISIQRSFEDGYDCSAKEGWPVSGTDLGEISDAFSRALMHLWL